MRFGAGWMDLVGFVEDWTGLVGLVGLEIMNRFIANPLGKRVRAAREVSRLLGPDRFAAIGWNCIGAIRDCKR